MTSPRMMQDPSHAQVQAAQMSPQAVAGNYPATGFYGSPYYNAPQPPNSAGNLGTELVRAQTNNQMVPLGNYTDGYPMARPEFSAPPPAENGYQGQGDYDDLDHRALLAQRDAQGKRKQIPPFVQKLSR